MCVRPAYVAPFPPGVRITSCIQICLVNKLNIVNKLEGTGDRFGCDLGLCIAPLCPK